MDRTISATFSQLTY